jgi:hypothetical protein
LRCSKEAWQQWIKLERARYNTNKDRSRKIKPVEMRCLEDAGYNKGDSSKGIKPE